MQQLYISSLKFVEHFLLFFYCFIVFLSNVRPKRLFSLIRALTPPPHPQPHPQRTVSVYILVYIVIYVQKCQKSVNYDINVHCSNQNLWAVCASFI